MTDNKKQVNPIAFIAIGGCFLGTGITLTAIFHSSQTSIVGIAITLVGVAFVLMGALRTRK